VDDRVIRVLQCKIGSKTHVGVAIWVGPNHPSSGSISPMSSRIETYIIKQFWTSGLDFAELLIFLALIFDISISHSRRVLQLPIVAPSIGSRAKFWRNLQATQAGGTCKPLRKYNRWRYNRQL